MQHSAYTISEIIDIVKGEPANGIQHNYRVKDILIDSRKLISPKECMFFALVSTRNDGHKYIKELYDRGIRNFMVSTLPDNPDTYQEANFIIVANTTRALQALAKAHRQKFNIPVIGITGSNGKTIIKEWLYQLMQSSQQIVRSPKSYNSQIGVPLSVWQMDKKNELAIFEAGISEPDEMDKLQPIIQPTIGIFSNIGEAHSENFISLHQKIGEKLKLFTKVDTLIYCSDHSELQEVIIRSEILESIKAFTWSRKQAADLLIREVIINPNKTTSILGTYNEKECSICIPFIDDASIENAIHCWAAMLCMGYENKTLDRRFKKLAPIAMRLELKAGINHCMIVNDSYNSDINSLSIALDFLNQQAGQKSKTVILSDILQSGKDEDTLYGNVAEIIHERNIDRLIGIGPSISRQAEKFKIEKVFYSSTEQFLSTFSFTYFNNEVILLKGARVFEFEQISKALQQKTHETILEINLNALIQNLNYFRTKLNQDTRIMAMVKAYSYGSGSFEIANTLQFHHVDYLAVAYADEGVELRKAGIAVPIMVMNPDEQSFDAIIKHNLEPEIFSFRILDMLEKTIRKSLLPRNKPVKIHIKLDTGMHRLGFTSSDIPELIERIIANKLIYTQSVFSHLAASEDASEDDFTRQQIERFRTMSTQIVNAVDHDVLLHILNSAGISRHPDAQFDMVRLGIGLYGIDRTKEDAAMLENVNTLKSTISQIKTVKPGETIGYNRGYKAEKEMQIGIVPIGYADGLNRELGNGTGKLYLKGHTAPIVGHVCMDMCMIDISGIGAKEGDEVIIFGKEIPIQQLAGQMDTIPYEILSGISRRVRRVYYYE